MPDEEGVNEPVEWQLEWRDDNTAESDRHEGGTYVMTPLDEVALDGGLRRDWEVELMVADGSTYIGIFSGVSRALAAAEFFELTGELPRMSTPRPRAQPHHAVAFLVVWVALVLVLGVGLSLAGVLH